MAMIKRGISAASSLECSSGNDLVRCPFCGRYISGKTAAKSGCCKYCKKNI